MRTSTRVTLIIIAGWVLSVLAYRFGSFDGVDNTKVGLALAVVFLGPLIIVWDWFYMRKIEKAEERDMP